MSSTDEEKALPAGKGEDEDVIVGQALPDEEHMEKAKSQEQKSSRSLKYLILSAILVIIVVVAITVPLVVIDNDDDDDIKSAPLEDSSSDNGGGSESGGGSGSGSGSGGGSGGSASPNITQFSVFHPDLPNFDTDILGGYTSEDEFAKGVTMGLQSLLDRAVGRNLGKPGYGTLATGGFGAMRDDVVFAPGIDVAEDGAAESASSVGVDKNVDDYGTNNQESGVEESDTVMSNGSHLFAAYADRVIVWNPASGEQVATIKLPEVEKEVNDEGGDTGERPPDIVPGAEPDESKEPPTRRRDSIWWGYYGVSVRSMLLLDDKLVVFASGYGAYQDYAEHVIDNYLATRVFVYDISGLPTTATAQEQVFKPMATKDLSGDYVSARAIEGNVHIVTTSRLLYWDRIIMPFERNWDDELREMSEEDYVATVVKRANEEVIPEFVTLLMDDVRIDGELPRFAKINTYDDGSGSSLSHLVYPNGYMDTIAFVFSFDIASVTSTSGAELTGVKAAGAVVPASYPIVYSSIDTMIIATAGTGYSEERDAMLTKTYLMSFLLDGSSAQPYTIGSVFGEIINQYSMDVVGGVLRIATTIRRAWFWGVPEPFIPEEDEGDESATSDSGSDTVTTNAEEPDRSDADDGTDVWEESTTENYIITISIAGKDHDGNATTPNVMEEYDSLKIGKPNESITAVRFFDKYAYAVTFERTDPFYKLNVEEPTNITELAAVEITGFSQYLHPFDSSEEIILALGQEADSEGRVLGLQISLFDLSDEKKPKYIRHNIEVDPKQWSSSEALWDPKAVRFNQEFGILIIPVYMYAEGSYFNGFKLFKVTKESISENIDCSIDFASLEAADTTESKVYSCGWLSPRNMIVSGSMVVLKDQWIARKDLTVETCDTQYFEKVLVDEKDTCWY